MRPITLPLLSFLFCTALTAGDQVVNLDEIFDYYIENLNDAITFFVGDGIPLPDVTWHILHFKQGSAVVKPLRRTEHAVITVKDSNHLIFNTSVGLDRIDVYYHILGLRVGGYATGITQEVELLVVHQDGQSCSATLTDVNFHAEYSTVKLLTYAWYIAGRLSHALEYPRLVQSGMASLRKVSSITTELLNKARIVPSSPVNKSACIYPSAPYSEFKNDAKKKEDDEFQKKESNAVGIHDGTVDLNEPHAIKELDESISVPSDVTSFIDETIDPTQLVPKTKQMSLMIKERLPWRSFLSLVGPSISIQPVRYKSDNGSSTCFADKCDQNNSCDMSKNEECKPRAPSMDLPLSCVSKPRSTPPCVPPRQKQWSQCDKSMCLPCCRPIDKPLKCRLFDIALNTCPRKTYRIAAYSECNKRYGIKQYKKECCYAKRICYSRKISDREVQPLLHIKDRQALVLGFEINK